MIRRPPRSTRTDTLFPYTTLFRSTLEVRDSGGGSWTFDRDNATLRVETPRTPFISWFGGGNGRAVLTLPDELEGARSEEHTSELQSLMRISYAVFCLKKKKNKHPHPTTTMQLKTHHQHNNTH